MAQIIVWESEGLNRRSLEHALRTAVAAVASLLAARLFRLPEAYWAPITTLVITQSSLGAALTVSWQRFVGTVIGAIVGALVASYLGPQVLVFGAAVFLLGLICAVAHADRSAYRLGGVTLTIVFLIPRTSPAWQVAFHRFDEVSIGIVVALLFTVVWPEKEVPVLRETMPSPSAPARRIVP
jgi:uncharacterized membrane protein YccC